MTSRDAALPVGLGELVEEALPVGVPEGEEPDPEPVFDAPAAGVGVVESEVVTENPAALGIE